MKQEYAQAFLEVLQDGLSLDSALIGLRTSMQKKGHSKLFFPVLFEVQRQLEAKKGEITAKVAVASEAEAKALKTQINLVLENLGADKTIQVDKVVDETLIGGFVATFDYKQHDQSYKKSLTNLYKSITN